MNDEGAQVLAKTWGFRPDVASSIDGATVSGARWRLDTRETPDVDLPSNVLALSLRACRTTRTLGGQTRTMSLRPGGVGLLAAGPTGRWSYDAPQDVFHLYLPPSLITRAAEQNGGRVKEATLREAVNIDDPFLKAAMIQAHRAMLQGLDNALYIASFTEVLTHHLLRYHAATSAFAAWPSSGGLADWQVKRASDLLEADISGEPSLADLAREVQLSPFHFARAFKASTGVPPHRYLVQLRIDKARELLEMTDLSVGEIAAQIGYDDPSYLARLFRREVGLTPAAYRRERRR